MRKQLNNCGRLRERSCSFQCTRLRTLSVSMKATSYNNRSGTARGCVACVPRRLSDGDVYSKREILSENHRKSPKVWLLS